MTLNRQLLSKSDTNLAMDSLANTFEMIADKLKDHSVGDPCMTVARVHFLSPPICR